MKHTLLILCSFVLTGTLFAQDFPGYRAGRYTGVNGVFFNPASIAGSPYRFDVNLFSFSTLVANDQASFKLNKLSESFQSDSLNNQLFGKNAGPASGMSSTDIHGPSVMFGVGKNGFALTTRARAFASVKDMDGKLISQLTDDFSPEGLPYTISSDEDMRLAVNAWTEFGLSYARVLSEHGPHVFKAGVTVKYLAGAGNGFVDINHFNTTLNADQIARDAYLSNTTGQISTGFGGIRISDFEASDLTKMESTGWGADLGFIYEFRPGSTKASDPYRFRLGVSVLDIGSIKYKKDMQRSGSYMMHVTGNQRLYMNELSDQGIDDYNAFFNSKPQYFTAAPDNTETSYKVSLPTTLQISADYHLHGGLYVSAAGQFALANQSKAYNNLSYSSFTLVPRFEKKAFGLYLPLNYNQLSKLNAGLSLRLGPVFVGSGSVISSLLGESKQLDLHFGLRFGMTK